MMIKITSGCQMGCPHCMNDAQPNGENMSFDLFRQVLFFAGFYSGPFLIITGGEPTEHPMFEEFIKYASECDCLYPVPMPFLITITTNGMWMQSHYDFVRWSATKKVTWQVTSVPNLYPSTIDESLDVFKLDNVVVCHEIERMYPQGRALKNNLPWQANASKCFNIRSLTRQLMIRHELGYFALRTVLTTMAANSKFCTPHIAPNGAIKLGESDLCPVCSWFSKPEHQIVDDILNFKCHKCDFINEKLPPEIRALIANG